MTADVGVGSSPSVLTVEIVETAELGNRSYIVDDGATAVVVDPQRDIDRIQDILARRSLHCAAVLETHVHNDYLTGGLALSREWGATYVVNRDDPVRFRRHGAVAGEQLGFGHLEISVVATPGHTATHLAYLVGGPVDGAAGLFSGGSLLYGGVGRTDLGGADAAAELARQQHRSVRRLAAELEPTTKLYPTHGFGSFCSAGASASGPAGTIGDELAVNPALSTLEEEQYVDVLLAADLPVPPHYRQMAPRNLSGPAVTPVAPPRRVTSDQVDERLRSGGWVVDIRHREEARRSHLPGVVHVELAGQFSTYVGWIVPAGEPVTLIGESEAKLHEAVRQLSRVGIDHVDVHIYRAETWDDAVLEDLPRRTFDEFLRNPSGRLIDVRTAAERAHATAYSWHTPFAEVLDHPLPDGELWLHCASGFRALTAASYLRRRGYNAGFIDDRVG